VAADGVRLAVQHLFGPGPPAEGLPQTAQRGAEEFAVGVRELRSAVAVSHQVLGLLDPIGEMRSGNVEGAHAGMQPPECIGVVGRWNRVGRTASAGRRNGGNYLATGWVREAHRWHPNLLHVTAERNRPPTKEKILAHTHAPLVVTALALSLVGAGTALTGTPATAAPSQGLRVVATDDSYTSSGRRSFNQGQADKLVIGRLDGDTKVSYLKFVVPAGTTVTGADLRLVAVGDPSGSITLNRIPATGWTEKSITSGSAPALGAKAGTGKTRSTTVGLEVVFDLDTIVTGPGTYAFALQSSAGNAVTRFRSAEAKFGAPALALQTGPAVPTPPVPAPVEPTPADPAPVEPTPADPTPADPTPADPELPVEPEPVPADPTPVPSVPTTPPATPTTPPVKPTTPPVKPTLPPQPAGTCVTGALLVPSCGVLWGAAAGGFTDNPRDAELKKWEQTSGRTASIYHTYHKGDEPFPTASEIAMTRDPARPRVLLLNWKIAYGSSWAKVAAGQQDARIDRFAARVKAMYNEKFFLVLNHEPENDVIARAGSGWTAKDFAAMYRHTILRLRAKGVDNAINVMAYMGNEKWMSQSWWKDLYPGDDVVDWMGLDSYVSAEKGAYHYGQFADLLDRKGNTGPTWYDWATTQHAKKPIMIAEWGVYHRVSVKVDKSAGYNSVLPELAKRPAIKAIVYFDTEADDQGDRNISISSTTPGLAAFRKLAANPIFNVTIR
jgi:hypothetical protein